MRVVKCAKIMFVTLAMSALAGGASADPAPIVYAAREPEAASAPVLAGGGETSYGYGRSRGGEGAVIDVRRGDSGSAAPVPSGEAPEWLERERVGPPYEANGSWYVPTPEPGYSETGIASWYGPRFHGQLTATGDVFDEAALTAAHPTLPIPSLVQVTNLDNGREIIVRVNDRGPFVGGRIIDLSRASAHALGFEDQGQARVHVRYLGPAPRRVDAAGLPIAETVEANNEGPQSLLPSPVAPAEPVAAPAPSLAATADYYVQVGAYSDLSNAQRVGEEIAASGPVALDVLDRAGRELFRVRVGPLASRAEALDAQRTLASLGYGDSLIAGP